MMMVLLTIMGSSLLEGQGGRGEVWEKKEVSFEVNRQGPLE